MPMTNCFIGYRLRQRLNEMEKKMQADEKKCLTSTKASNSVTDIGGDVAGPQPTKET